MWGGDEGGGREWLSAEEGNYTDMCNDPLPNDCEDSYVLTKTGIIITISIPLMFLGSSILGTSKKFSPL